MTDTRDTTPSPEKARTAGTSDAASRDTSTAPPQTGPIHFAYDEEDVALLAGRDPLLARVMEAVGPVRREILPDLFTALVHSVVGQQISSKVHAVLWKRVLERFGTPTPERYAALEEAELRACGLSGRKASYIAGIAKAFAEGRMRADDLARLDDEAFCETLVALPGVGRWTAEMLLIFSLGRKNVLSLGDHGIRKGLRMLYGVKEVTPDFAASLKKRYSPCATVASLYLWELAGGALEGYVDPAADRPPKGPKRASGTGPHTGTAARSRAVKTTRSTG